MLPWPRGARGSAICGDRPGPSSSSWQPGTALKKRVRPRERVTTRGSGLTHDDGEQPGAVAQCKRRHDGGVQKGSPQNLSRLQVFFYSTTRFWPSLTFILFGLSTPWGVISSPS